MVEYVILGLAGPTCVSDRLDPPPPPRVEGGPAPSRRGLLLGPPRGAWSIETCTSHTWSYTDWCTAAWYQFASTPHQDLSLFYFFLKNYKTIPSLQSKVSSIYKYPKCPVWSSFSPLYDHPMVILGRHRPNVHIFRYLWSYSKQKRIPYKPQSN
jgi:hypothetical protein